MKKNEAVISVVNQEAAELQKDEGAFEAAQKIADFYNGVTDVIPGDISEKIRIHLCDKLKNEIEEAFSKLVSLGGSVYSVFAYPRIDTLKLSSCIEGK